MIFELHTIPAVVLAPVLSVRVVRVPIASLVLFQCNAPLIPAGSVGAICIVVSFALKLTLIVPADAIVTDAAVMMARIVGLDFIGIYF